jgi:hypothetical protein
MSVSPHLSTSPVLHGRPPLQPYAAAVGQWLSPALRGAQSPVPCLLRHVRAAQGLIAGLHLNPKSFWLPAGLLGFAGQVL